MTYFWSTQRILTVFFFLLGSCSFCNGQIYKYLGIENGLSNRRIFHIQKGGQGYMWFLTQEGIDRYDGRIIKHYTVLDGSMEMAPQINLDWLYTDSGHRLWVVGRKGRIFRYDTACDRFVMVYKLKGLKEDKATGTVKCTYMDSNDRIWLCHGDSIIRYDTRTGITDRLNFPSPDSITVITQADSTYYFLGTSNGLLQTREKEGNLQIIRGTCTDSIRIPISQLYYHSGSKKLFIATFKEGILVYDMNTNLAVIADGTLQNVGINRITPFGEKQLLVATGGRGIYSIDVDSHSVQPYITADYSNYNGMNGNNINDIYVDRDGRIWMANYPTGVTIRNDRYRSYKWLKHSPGNNSSLVNNQVHDVIRDSEGDLWFATSNGISMLQGATGQWTSFLTNSERLADDDNHIFLTLCEVSPGIVWAGGYTSGIYTINKKKGIVGYISPYSLAGISPDQYISDIKKDSQGDVWSGGYYNLKRINPETGTIRLYPGLSSITAILEKNEEQMWIGTTTGVYLLDKLRGNYRRIDFPVETVHVSTLYQTVDGILYVGTRGAGLLVYDSTKDKFVHQYHMENCAIVSDNIYIVIPRPDGSLLLGTENSIATFLCKDRTFHNWTAEQGLMSVCFNAGAATQYGDSLVFGSNDGIVLFPIDMQIPVPQFSRMILRDFTVSSRPVYSNEEGSPLIKDSDGTHRLELAYNQNTFSLEAVSINYDYPSNILYSWKLEGFYNGWSHPSTDGQIHLTGLPPGRYTLRIRAISNEEKDKIYEEKDIVVVISRPPWASTWAIAGYILLAISAVTIAFRIVMLRRQRKLSEEKTQFFIHTAHDIRTPLTLIKAPLEEVVEKKQVKIEGADNVRMALKSVDNLLQLVTDLINFERADVYTSQLYIGEYELDSYLDSICETFRTYASQKSINLSHESRFPFLNVWFDRDKMDSILKNLLSNALKYTPRNGNVHICAFIDQNTWNIEVRDTGIGIPAGERKNLGRRFFRGSNAVNQKVPGSGIGLLMVYKLVRLHKGKIIITSTEEEGTCVRVTFPMGNRHLRKAHFITAVKAEKTVLPHTETDSAASNTQTVKPGESASRILVVEDNDDLREYIKGLLGQEYHVLSCTNGCDALVVAPEYNPDLILSDVMMPEMGGDELCAAIKSNIETSHIPVILLTALSDEKNMLKGLDKGADAYITKPFSVNVLKANIRSILANRALLRKTYAGLESGTDPLPEGCSNVLDWKFIVAVRECVMEHISSPDFNVDTLCEIQHMSRSSFFNKLKTLTGYAPADYIRFIRLQHAARLLRQERCPITEVADATGFSDAKYFREVFRKHYGVSPSEYRKTGGNDDTTENNNANI
ncbi:MAG: response regulator [Bacteroides thetaiotaomicron]|uniref:histidine kinase n=1 Tax=Bacteroides thetaiotaomicron TaxID=818 RepID=A0A943DZB4_BACT4|nr:response regulator [Bacteroides thetaiotaomicron]